jgi:TonB family protein
MRVGRSEECSPVLTNAFAVQSFAQQAFARQIRTNPMRQRPSQVTMDFVIDSTGAVRGAHVHTSSGVPDMDEIARQAVQQGRYQPALLNRRAVGTFVRMPFAFTVTPPNRPSGTRP